MDTTRNALVSWRRRMTMFPVLALATVAAIVAGSGPAFGAPLGPIKVALVLDGQVAGLLDSAEGGMAASDVVNEKAGSDHIVHKHIGNPKYEDFTIQTGLTLGPAVYQWIQAMISGKTERKSGSIVVLDRDGSTELRRMDWRNGLITEVSFPALDAASKDACKMSIKISPETTRVTRYGGAQFSGANGLSAFKQKAWLCSNFRIKIGNLDASRVNKIEALTIKQKILDDPQGQLREPAALEYPNLAVTLADLDADGFWAWHEDFVVKGNNGQDQERSATLEYLGPGRRSTPLFTLALGHIGIFKLTPDKMEAGAEDLRRVKAEMYVEEMTFDVSPAAWQ